MTPQLRFLSACYCGPLLKSDAIVVLSGDGEIRLPAAVELYRTRAAPLIVASGGVDNPPYSLHADAMMAKLMGLGVHHEKIVTERESQNTREQAVNLCRVALEKKWGRVLLITSPYHAPRASLSFVQALTETGEERNIHVVCVPASNAPWFGKPEGLEVTRMELLDVEMGKIAEYQERGHVASWEAGVEYARFWERGK